MEFSSLVLMEREKETNFLIKEMGSYEVGDGAEFVTKLFYDGEIINLYFDTKNDVEEWEFSAIFDLFNEEAFISDGYFIEGIDSEYNPTWLVKFNYSEEHNDVKNDLNKVCRLIDRELINVFENIKGKEEEYK